MLKKILLFWWKLNDGIIKLGNDMLQSKINQSRELNKKRNRRESNV